MLTKRARADAALRQRGRPPWRTLTARRTAADRVFRGAATLSGVGTLLVLALIGLFLMKKGWPALSHEGLGFFTGTKWTETGPFGIAAVMYWTVIIAAIALVLALPFSVLTALFITEYAPPRIRKPLTSLVDLLAAVPSLIFGLWGLSFVQPHLANISRWISDHFSFIPVFKADKAFAGSAAGFKSSAFIAGVVVAVSIVPIITSVVREVFSQAPSAEKEAALALGGRRWGMIRTVVLPYGRGGIVGGAMLGLGRALGETIAVVLIISTSFRISPHVLQTGANSVAALIALRIKDSHGLVVNALMAAGLALFAVTLAVNTLAAVVVSRSRSGSGVDL